MHTMEPRSLRYNPPQQQQQQLQLQMQISPVFKSISHSETSSFEDVSFSSFLKPKDQNDAAPEISIFDAHKYFCENNSRKKEAPPPSLTRLSSVSSDGYGRNSRIRSFHATPTASSEASWNSQTGLLVNPPGSLNNLPSRNNNKNKKGTKNGIFRRKSSCCCTGGNSVRVNEATSTVDRNNSKSHAAEADHPQRAKPLSITSEGHHIAQIHPHKKFHLPENIDFPVPVPADPPRQRRISASGRPFVDVAGGFSFPILKNPTLQAAKPDPKENGAVEDPPRDSLEVFQPNTDDPVGGRSSFNPGSPRARVETTDDDLGSDASSDLFELESFSTNTTVYPTYRRRDSLDEALTFNARRFASANGLNPKNNTGGRRSLDEPPTTPSVAATECYAPSEVSIDWSVTTAEGPDGISGSNFSASASEIDGAAISRQRIPEEGGGKKKGSGGGGLMSCRGGKAVSVGPQPVKCSAAEGGGGTPAHVVGRPPRATKTTTLVNDHARRMSLAFGS